LIWPIPLITAAVITGVLAMFHSEPSVPAAPTVSTPTSPVVSNCVDQQRAAYNWQQQHRDTTLRYSGPSEDQCHLNDVVDQVRKSQAPSVPATPGRRP
jgi:hypothetical protein